ncbi:hypothetical protein PR003_g693 [Phytophthora rubi]|uniref:Secreted protein n=1 Tax=Phytophthora rubi TaxID=129364 RepID=A0A6A3NMY5_9STRA|nr:hypothetical protein PR002_g1974 [Phytophthora rubi]KAE9052043.1 hypothetical protein PR001_g865 [Phytophthora rubi]KAE9359516.1 hypothetical protein PR003_g693 [Phytophthora rubi]
MYLFLIVFCRLWCNTIDLLLLCSTHDDPILTFFLCAHKIFRCTHGVSQSSCSKGHRNRKTRYCGCNARFTAAVTPTDDDEFIIKIMNEVR